MITKNNKFPLLAAGGLAAGFINGLLGAGGGILAVFLLSKLLRQSQNPLIKLDRKDVFANALAIMLPATAVSAFRYMQKGALPLDGAALLILPAIVGGMLGALLLNKMQAQTANRIFSFIVIYSGIAMLVKG